MKLNKKNLGKVSVTIEKDYHNIIKEYDKLVVVEEEGQFRTFISRKPVPVGIELTDREFWLPFSSVKESIVIDYNKFKQYIRTGEGLLDDSIVERHIKDRNITGNKIAEATITFVNIADNTLTLNKINNEAIDKTLTKEGHLAEAKHTGDRLLNIESLSVVKVPSTQSTVLDAWQIIDKNGNVHGVTINTYKDKSIDAIWLSVNEEDAQPEDLEIKIDNPRYLNIVYNKADGTKQKVSIPLASFVTEAEFSKNGFKVIDGIVNLKISSDITTSRYFHFDADGNITLDGFEERILEDLGTFEHSESGDRTMWGEFKKQESIREQISNSAHQVFSDNWDEEDDNPEEYKPLSVTEASYAYNWKSTDNPASDGSIQGNLKDLYQNTLDSKKKLSELETRIDQIDLQESDTDLSIEDRNGYSIVSFTDGHIKTSKFNSKDLPAKFAELQEQIIPIENNDNQNLEICDLDGNSIVIFKDGHIYTRNFNSSRIKDIVAQDNAWKGKKIAFYGDSLTAQCNGDITNYNDYNRDKWVTLVAKELDFAIYYGRGVGGQTYRWNTSGWYCKKDSTGNYVNRYRAKNGVIEQANGQIVYNESAENIAAIEAVLGYQIEVHRGCFCSWDRITAMFPKSIKDDIRTIFLMGGANDFSAAEETEGGGTDSPISPQFSASNTTDIDWINSSYYLGGDYDLSNTWGAMASTIMKMRVWMPYAQIIIMTPITRKGINYNCPINNKGYTQKQLTDDIKKVASFCNCPVIDLFSDCGINQYNVDTMLQSDGIHPNANGWKLMSDCIISQIKNIKL